MFVAQGWPLAGGEDYPLAIRRGTGVWVYSFYWMTIDMERNSEGLFVRTCCRVLPLNHEGQLLNAIRMWTRQLDQQRHRDTKARLEVRIAWAKEFIIS